MNISELLKEKCILPGVHLPDKTGAIYTLSGLLFENGYITESEGFVRDVLLREKKGSTYVGHGIAIPHAKSSYAREVAIAAAAVPDGVLMGENEKNRSELLFMFAVPEGEGDLHIKILSRLMKLLDDRDFRKKLRRCKTSGDFIREMRLREKELQDEELMEKEGTRKDL